MRTSLIQLTSSDDPLRNTALVCDFIDQAAEGGAAFVLTPEVTNCVSLVRAHQFSVLRHEADDPTLAAVRERAARHGIWILIGSLALRTSDADGRFANRSFLIAPDGAIAARYDKIHMFDVAVSEAETYHESQGYRPGAQAVITPMPFGILGMTICYDLRFAQLYRHLAQAGASVITVPSAFSRPTGEAHWETLMRARAIDTGAYILAPAQTGVHAAQSGGSRQTWGHSLIVDPWGTVLEDAGERPGMITVDLDPKAVAKARASIPAMTQETEFVGPQ
ncbi:MAG: carbon-nitrogen hydrolase family protein [Roseovarius sp.]